VRVKKPPQSVLLVEFAKEREALNRPAAPKPPRISRSEITSRSRAKPYAPFSRQEIIAATGRRKRSPPGSRVAMYFAKHSNGLPR
jgi:hypothetical protein